MSKLSNVQYNATSNVDGNNNIKNNLVLSSGGGPFNERPNERGREFGNGRDREFGNGRGNGRRNGIDIILGGNRENKGGKKPVTKKPIAKKPATKKPVAKKPATK